MSEERELWEAYDTRTGRFVSMYRYRTEEDVLTAIKHWKDRDAAGGRPDLHDTIPFVSHRRAIPASEESKNNGTPE